MKNKDTKEKELIINKLKSAHEYMDVLLNTLLVEQRKANVLVMNTLDAKKAVDEILYYFTKDRFYLDNLDVSIKE